MSSIAPDQGPNPATTLPKDHLGALLIAVIMMALGWLGLAETIRGSAPSLRTVFQLIVLLFFATSGTAMPIVFYFNVRFVPVARALPSSGVIVRQSAWVGCFVVGCACLQLLYIGSARALNLWTALVLAALLFAMECRIRWRELKS